MKPPSVLLWAAGPPAQGVLPWGCKPWISQDSFIVERKINVVFFLTSQAAESMFHWNLRLTAYVRRSHTFTFISRVLARPLVISLSVKGFVCWNVVGPWIAWAGGESQMLQRFSQLMQRSFNICSCTCNSFKDILMPPTKLRKNIPVRSNFTYIAEFRFVFIFFNFLYVFFFSFINKEICMKK